MTLRMVSLQAPNADFLYRKLAACLARAAGVSVEVVETPPWRERERMLDRGEAQIGVICGLPYVLRAERAEPPLELLAAPVMAGPRYGGRPVYFSDVVVHRGSSYRCFADLRGCRWSFNEPGSQSGYNVTRYHLATLGERSGYFGQVEEAGAHQRSLRLIIEGRVDASAIDSTVLELELALHPELASSIRVVETLGPSPIPPLVVSRRVPEPVRRRLRSALLELHRSAEGAALLAEGMMERYVAVQDEDYHPIRRMAREADGVSLHPTLHPAVRAATDSAAPALL